ncbi:MAG: SpoIIE family protein phosphatase [Treponema sp.]|nr:SpoIIE family protein phosphatase [Treponema sp.]
MDSRFPVAVSDGNTAAIFFEEVGKSQIWIDVITQDKNQQWTAPRRIAGPFSYSGDVPDLFSAAMTPDGTIAVAVLMNAQSVGVYVSRDSGSSFVLSKSPPKSLPVVGPRIFCTSNGGFRLFATLGENDSFSLLTATSQDGADWTSFEEFAPAKGMTNPFTPYLASYDGKDFVVFQAYHTTGAGARFSHQLYVTHSMAGQEQWTPPVLITDQRSLPSKTVNPYTNYHNQRPSLAVFDSALYVAWERTFYTSESARIWTMQLNENGEPATSAEELTTDGNARRPQFFVFDGALNVVWFDNRRGTDSVYMARKNGFLWEESKLATPKQSATFSYPLVTGGGSELSFIWQQATGKKNNFRINGLETDRTVSPPSIVPQNFTAGKRSASEKATARVRLPSDSSGIAGYSWIWTDDPAAEPPKTFMRLPDELNLSGNAPMDGTWYFKVRATDYAGNWSAPAVLAYTRDTTPPLAPIILPKQTDRFGFLESNTFSMGWEPNPQDTDDIAGYSWTLSHVAPFEKAITQTSLHPITLSDAEVERRLQSVVSRYPDIDRIAVKPPRYSQGKKTSASYKNRSNGLYTFSVCAIDSVGNIGPAATVVVLLNKYVPSTFVTSVNAKADTFGAVTLSILGGGFTYDGTIRQVYIDHDGQKPYDRVFEPGEFKVRSDERITDVHFEGLDAGSYKIGLLHPDRGLYFSKNILTVNDYGTVKIETPFEYTVDWKPITKNYFHHIQTGTLLVWGLFALALLGFFAALRGMVLTARDVVAVRSEVRALLTGGAMPQEKRRHTEHAIKRSGSLKYKLVGFTTVLVLMIVSLVSIPLGFFMSRTQERTLAKGLQERIQVLMEGIASGAKAYLPGENVMELSYLPSQTNAVEEADYATILGFPSNESSTNLDYIWASNDDAISQKIDTEIFLAGISRLSDERIAPVMENCALLREKVSAEVGELAGRIAALNAEGATLLRHSDALSVRRRDEIGTVTEDLNKTLNESLTRFSRESSGAIPDFDPQILDRTNTDYLFYMPVLYRPRSGQDYVHGVVLVQISTQNLIQSADAARHTIMLISGIVAIGAIILGSIGSLIMASIFIRPIRRLVAHVEMISETQDKEKLAGKEIHVTSKDEIGLLGDTVNEMTRSLVKAAQDEHLLMDGQVVQRTFLPLSASANGAKETTSALIEEHVRIFGYYEGASGVSGDYFDYKKLDDRWYVIIKSDASGHGVPAALIMTVVATIFRKYFERWTFQANGISLNKLVVQINDFIESLGLKGKFATIMLCLFDTKNGDVYMCNAGDNIIHYYDISEHKQKLVSLSQTPAAGPLPSFMVDMKGGFKVEKLHLDKGDVLFLYTDGIEEATRKFRDAQFMPVRCTEGVEGADHGNHKVGEESEQLTPERIDAIVEAVFAKKSYHLEKYHNPVAGEELIFDFSDCEGTVDDAILALISVEKVFRFYKEPGALESDVVRVDRKIDSFLQKHFNRYEQYCSQHRDTGDVNYLYYTHLKEDEQLDDLTLIALRYLG